MASYMYHSRSLRGGRSSKGRYDSEEEHVHLDFNKAPSEIIHNILIHVVKQGISKSCKLGYLNSLVKFCSKIGSCHALGFSKEELFCCLRVALLHEACEVRAAGLRALRYLLWDRDSVEAFCRVQMPFLIARCLDIVLDNRIERVQALRLVRKILSVDPHQFPCALTNCLVAIASDEAQERDILGRACLAVLCELALLNPEACAVSGGLSTILRNVLDCQQPHIGEALIGVILFLLNDPKTRHLLGNSVTLENVLAPFTDCHFRYSADISDHNLSDDRESRFIASKQAIVSILRSWSGLIYLCRPEHAGLQSLIDMLYLPYSEIRKNILDLLYDLFCLPVPEWTDDFITALISSDPSSMQCSWQLYEGFVAAEGTSILPPVTKHRTNLIENYFALLLLAFVQTGLLEAVVEVITCSDNFISVRATVLLGELLHMANRLLPTECSHHCNCLPTLISVATSFESFPNQRNQASAAINYLNQIHVLKKRNIVPCSLFLDQLLHFCNPHISKDKCFGDSISRAKLWHYLRKDADDMITQAIKDSQVLYRDYTNWDWDLIGAILKWPCETLRKLEDVNHRSFIKKLLHFYKPTSKQFSSFEADREIGHQICIVGCHMIDFLLEAEETKAKDFICEFLIDVNLCLSQVTIENAPLHAIFSPTRLISTLSHAYFLLIGRLSNSHKGRKFLEKSGVSQFLLELVSVTSHDTYIKLIVSSLDYTKDGLSRMVLTKILTSTSENARLYATNYMRVLMRARLTDFHKWAIELLVTQLCDKCKAVSLAAADILEEACDIQENLEALISLRPPLLHYGDKGLLLLLRFLAVTGGFRFLRDSNFLGHELHKWNAVYNLKYVKIVEDCLNEALTHHRRGEDGAYGHRFSNARYQVYNAFIPPHMYGQLACHKEGLDMLLREECLTPLFETIKSSNCVSQSNILHLKAALWAIGNIGSSCLGLPLVLEANVIPQIVKLAQEATVFSIRGICFYVLGLLSSTSEGADSLAQYGWEAIRRTHDEKWPLVWNHIALDEFPDDDARSYAWSVSSGDSEWLGESFTSRLSFLARDNDNTRLPNTPSAYSLCLEENYMPSCKQSMKWNISESNIFPSKAESYSTHSLPRQQVSETRPRSSSDGRSSCNSDYKTDYDEFDQEKSMSRPEIIWKIGSTEDIIKDRSSSFGGTQETVNKSSVKERSISDLEVSNKKVTLSSYLLGSKGGRSSSNESSHTSASKSRSGSSTDSTTSGISSCDSIAPRLYHSDHAQTLSPIASSTSLNTVSNRSTPSAEHFHKPFIVPRPLSFVSTSISRKCNHTSSDVSTPTFNFTSVRDALGYVTLKDIQKKRIQSLSFDEDKCTWPELRRPKSCSIEYDIPNYDLGCDYFGAVENSSSRRLSASSQSSTITSSTGKATDVLQEKMYHIGLCLPLDYRMVLSLHDCKECGTSTSEINAEQEYENPCSSESATLNQASVDGLKLHSQNSCMACKKWHIVKVLQISEVTTSESDETVLCEDRQEASSPCESGIYSPAPTDKHSMKSSIESAEVIMPESYTSSSTMEGGSCHLNEEMNWGRSLIYKEVMRFVTNMSSSIALKASEQGLLNLKQKFPSAFQDICLYTEISLYLANYSFPWNARRFLQELFLDTSFNELYRDAEALLDLTPCVITLSEIDSSDT